jgi:predicted enzyme related to lactoylglutathione lyase
MENPLPPTPLNWFEIPVRDMARAQAFYEALFQAPLRRERLGAYELAIFPHAEGQVGGWLIQGGEAPAPANVGTVVYLAARPTVEAALARARRAGGQVAAPRVALPGERGCIAQVFDPEGNRVGLHAAA